MFSSNRFLNPERKGDTKAIVSKEIIKHTVTITIVMTNVYIQT